jgi:hypothetical protein
MRSLIAIAPVAAFALGSCTQPPAPPGAAFAQTVAGRIAGPPQSCVSHFGSDHPYVIDPQTLAYGYGRTIYVNRLGAPCPGVDQSNILITESYGGMYCRGDRIRGSEPGAIIPGPVCILHDWVPYRTR